MQVTVFSGEDTQVAGHDLKLTLRPSFYNNIITIICTKLEAPPPSEILLNLLLDREILLNLKVPPRTRQVKEPRLDLK